MFAVDDGLINGNLNLADVLFAIAVILFVLDFIFAVAKRPIYVALTPLGLAFVAAGWLVL